VSPLAALQLAADAMRRSDPSYCEAHGVAQTTDAEWEAALEAVEDAIDDGTEENTACLTSTSPHLR
jgi:hypothetical protein